MSFAVEYKFHRHQVKYIMLRKRFLQVEKQQKQYLSNTLTADWTAWGVRLCNCHHGKVFSSQLSVDSMFVKMYDVCMYVCWLKKNLLLNKWFDNSKSKNSVTVRQLVPWWKYLCQIYGLQQHCEQICRGKEILFQSEFSFSLEPKINCLK